MMEETRIEEITIVLRMEDITFLLVDSVLGSLPVSGHRAEEDKFEDHYNPKVEVVEVGQAGHTS
jgi:hypothetical protein